MVELHMNKPYVGYKKLTRNCVSCGRKGKVGDGVFSKTYQFCIECRRERITDVLRERIRIRSKEMQKLAVRLRKLIIRKYGNQCICCHESIYLMLAIDHVHNNGYIERKKGLRGLTFLFHIIENDYPPDYQVLCHNCNIAKYRNGGICPHTV